MTKLTTADLDNITMERLSKLRNEIGTQFNDRELFIFTIEWENACNTLNKNRKKRLIEC